MFYGTIEPALQSDSCPYLFLVGQKSDVDLLEVLDELGDGGLAEVVEEFVGAGLREVDVQRPILSGVRVLEVHDHTTHRLKQTWEVNTIAIIISERPILCGVRVLEVHNHTTHRLKQTWVVNIIAIIIPHTD